MKSFLQEVTEEVLKLPDPLNEMVFVLPSKRAGTFLRNEFLKANTKTVFGPVIYSIEDFVQELSGLKLAPNTTLIFEFYQIYCSLTDQNAIEDFYSFSKWAPTVLADFNEVDRYLIPPDKIFNYLAAVKELDHWYLQEHKTQLQKNYIRFWNTLENYYKNYKSRLLNIQQGYQGLIYREAVENLEAYLQNTSKRHVFIGFNALNTAEATIIQEFLEATKAIIYWDVEKSFLEDSEHDAAFFIRQYKDSWKYYQKQTLKNISDHFSKEKEINIIGIPKNIGQTMYVGELLGQLHKADPELNKTAVILGNESLLAPMINAIPKEISTVNITSGFPLKLSPVASLLNTYFEMLNQESERGWYYKYVLDLLSHPASRELFTYKGVDYASKIVKNTVDENHLHLNLSIIKEIIPEALEDISTLFFLPAQKDSIQSVVERCLAIILKLKDHYQAQQKPQLLFLEYLYRFYEIFNQINTLNTTYKSINNIKALKGVYKEFLLHETVDFQGEPLEGLQIMGVLESRNLDFETVIITSVNEGILPSGKNENSLIPFDVKSNFGLPTYREKDAIYAYHFYHLLQRAKRIYLLYNTEPDVLEGSEKSRFLLQLSLDKKFNHRIKEIIAGSKIQINLQSQKTIVKTKLLIEALNKGAQKGVSPTALANYIRNPIDFYYQTVLGIKNEGTHEEVIAANTLGTVVHNTLESLYKPLEGSFLMPDHIEEMQAKIDVLVRKEFKNVYKSGDIERGKNLIIYKVAIKYIEKFLAKEKETLKSGARIKILHIESDLKTKVNIPGLQTDIFLKGKVDRVDEKDGTLRIIDYKTGKVNQTDLEIIEWDSLITDYKYSKAFQVLMYAYMLQNTINHPVIEAGVISFKNMSSGFLRFAEKDSPRATHKRYGITADIYQKFTEQFNALVLEIFNPEIPFTEKEIP